MAGNCIWSTLKSSYNDWCSSAYFSSFYPDLSSQRLFGLGCPFWNKVLSSGTVPVFCLLKHFLMAPYVRVKVLFMQILCWHAVTFLTFGHQNSWLFSSFYLMCIVASFFPCQIPTSYNHLEQWLVIFLGYMKASYIMKSWTFEISLKTPKWFYLCCSTKNVLKFRIWATLFNSRSNIQLAGPKAFGEEVKTKFSSFKAVSGRRKQDWKFKKNRSMKEKWNDVVTSTLIFFLFMIL